MNGGRRSLTGRIARITRFGILYSLCSYTPARAYAGLYTLRAFRDVPRTTRISYKKLRRFAECVDKCGLLRCAVCACVRPFRGRKTEKKKKKEHKTYGGLCLSHRSDVPTVHRIASDECVGVCTLQGAPLLLWRVRIFPRHGSRI